MSSVGVNVVFLGISANRMSNVALMVSKEINDSHSLATSWKCFALFMVSSMAALIPECIFC